MRYFAITITILALLVAGGSAAIAGENEYDIISEAFVVTDFETGTVEEAEAVYEDIFDIYQDTQPMSYCEDYAAIGTFIAGVMAEAIAIRDDNDLWTPEHSVNVQIAFGILAYEYEAAGQRCLMED